MYDEIKTYINQQIIIAYEIHEEKKSWAREGAIAMAKQILNFIEKLEQDK